MEDNLLKKYKKSLKRRLLIRRIAYGFFAVMFGLSVLAFFIGGTFTREFMLLIGIARLAIWGLPLLFIIIKEDDLLNKDKLNPKKEVYATYCLVEKELDNKKNNQDTYNEVEEIKRKTEELKKQLEK